MVTTTYIKIKNISRELIDGDISARSASRRFALELAKAKISEKATLKVIIDDFLTLSENKDTTVDDVVDVFDTLIEFSKNTKLFQE